MPTSSRGKPPAANRTASGEAVNPRQQSAERTVRVCPYQRAALMASRRDSCSRPRLRRLTLAALLREVVCAGEIVGGEMVSRETISPPTISPQARNFAQRRAILHTPGEWNRGTPRCRGSRLDRGRRGRPARPPLTDTRVAARWNPAAAPRLLRNSDHAPVRGAYRSICESPDGLPYFMPS